MKEEQLEKQLEKSAKSSPKDSDQQIRLIEIALNDRLGRKCKVKCYPNDTILQLKRLAAAQIGTRSVKIKLQKWHTVFQDHLTLEDYQIHEGSSIEMHYY